MSTYTLEQRKEVVATARVWGITPPVTGQRGNPWNAWKTSEIVERIQMINPRYEPPKVGDITPVVEKTRVEKTAPLPTTPVVAAPIAPVATAAPSSPDATEAATKAVEAIRELIGGSGQVVEAAKAAAITAALWEVEIRLKTFTEGVDDLIATKVEAVARGVKTIEVVAPTYELPQMSHPKLGDLVKVLGAGMNAYLVGPPGTGKTFMARQAAEVLGLPFYTTSMGPTTPTSKLMGYQDATGSYVRSLLREAYENGGVFLFDELDKGNAGIVAEMNQMLANGAGAFPDGMVDMHQDCRIVAAANTHGTGPDRQFVGSNQLDAATLDRFVEIEVGIDEALEDGIVAAIGGSRSGEWLHHVRKIRRAAVELRVPMIVSPRASIHGARLLQAGFTWGTVCQMALWKGTADSIRTKLEIGR